MELVQLILTEINSLNVANLEQMVDTEQKDLEALITVSSILMKAEYYFMKWALNLYTKYHADVKQLITFVFKD